MSLRTDWGLRVRIVGALALVLGVNTLVLSAVAWSVRGVLSASGRSFPIDIGLPLAAGTILVGALGLVVLQARYGSRTVVSGLEVDELGGTTFEGDGPRNSKARVRRLTAQADVPTPSVAVADRDEPGCLTVGPQRSPTIVVTSGLLESLGDDELEAALAHEVAHVANRDLLVATAVAATVALGDRLLERERMLRRVLEVTVWAAVMSGIGLLVLAIPILMIGAAYLVVSLVARALLGVNAIALGIFSKEREFAADRGASELTGDPAALAGALETLEDVRPKRDARIHASATLGIVPGPLSLEGEESEEDDEHWLEPWLPDLTPYEHPTATRGDTANGSGNRIGERVGRWIRERIVVPITSPVKSNVRRALEWRPSTHPRTEARVDRLRTSESRADRRRALERRRQD